MFSEKETREDMKKCPNFTLYISFGDVIVAQILSSSIDGMVHAKTGYLGSAKSCKKVKK